MFFDSHAHLDDRRFADDRTQVLEKIRAANVTGVMNIGCDEASSLRSIDLAEQNDWIWAAVGNHPDSADEVDEALLARYRDLCRHRRVKAIGEIGLDYHYEDIPREIQKRAFRMQMALAQELSMPVVVHEREAHADALEILDEFESVRGVFHCYSGSLEMAKELVRRGWYIGFTGVVTFKNARKAVEVAEWLPLSRTLIETDCPYMAPEPHRGRRCDPSLVPFTAAKIAEIKGVSVETVADATKKNAEELFRLV
ncbi:MAG: TatD family hydrolase [Oscillospiraceae bacterium]|nr:TatD family hydrolase [Oscillospiraceae bacterium]